MKSAAGGRRDGPRDHSTTTAGACHSHRRPSPRLRGARRRTAPAARRESVSTKSAGLKLGFLRVRKLNLPNCCSASNGQPSSNGLSFPAAEISIARRNPASSGRATSAMGISESLNALRASGSAHSGAITIRIAGSLQSGQLRLERAPLVDLRGSASRNRYSRRARRGQKEGPRAKGTSHGGGSGSECSWSSLESRPP